MKPTPTGPPRWADRFLEWYCRPELLEEIQGDAYELFDKRIKDLGAEVARRRFAWDVLRSFRLSTIKHFNPNLSPMLLKNNFKIAWRQLLKQKMYSVIKIGGFALGVAACLLIALYIKDELSYDKHYPDSEQIYRALGTRTLEGKTEKSVHFPAPLAKALVEDYPEIEQAGRFLASPLFGARSTEVRPEERRENTHEEGFIFADQALLEILQVEMVYGELEHALDQPNTIVLSKSKAEQYYPNEDPVGKNLILNNDLSRPYKIGGVMEDLPSNSHLHEFDFWRTMEDQEFWEGEQNFWRASNYHTYIKVKPGTDEAQLEEKLMGIVEKYVIPVEEAEGNLAIREELKGIGFDLQPVASIHLTSQGVRDRLSHGDIRFVWLFGGIAIFILLIATINFINLSTAKSANRAKEVGLRKVVGSFRSNLINQFLTESILFSLMSFVLGTFLAWGLLPFFNEVAAKTLTFPWTDWRLFPTLLIGAIGVGLLAGLYPAVYLSGFKPINVLKGAISMGSKSSRMRSGLVIFQFTTSIILIIGTAIIHRQMDFILNKEIGFDKDQVLLIQGANTLDDKVATFKQNLLDMPMIKQVSVSDYLPITGTKRNGNGFWKEGKVNEDPVVSGQMWRIDHDYVETMGMKIVAGRDFSIEMPTDSQGVLVNQQMVDQLHLEDPIGQRITNSGTSWPIIGVVEDFHFESLKNDIGPLCMAIGNGANIISAKVTSEDMPALLAQVTASWDQFAPHQPIRYTFLDESYAYMYADVQRMERIFSSFAILAIIVACLGLFALSAFMAEQRSKEIGIRKVLGASVNSLIQLLTSHFLLLVFASFVLAVPIAWYMMQKWLEDYAYPTPISWVDFLLSGLLAILIAVVTISFQAIRAARGNPIEAIRTE